MNTTIMKNLSLVDLNSKGNTGISIVNVNKTEIYDSLF